MTASSPERARIVAGGEHSLHVRHLQPAPPVDVAPMGRDDLWHTAEMLSRLLGEVSRRKLGESTFEHVDQARIIALGLYSVAP